MKFIRYGEAGKEKPGIEINGQRYDITPWVEDINEAFFTSKGPEKVAKEFTPDPALLLPSELRLGPPIQKPGKIICVGLNYRKHAKESGMAAPEEPILFFKATSAIVGPNDTIVIPRNSKKTDWEVELAVVIGKQANYVSEAEALDYVAGYTIHNDVSERAFQLEHGGQWVKGKSCDTFAPLGPWLVTKDEIPNPNNLNLWLSVNGRKVQDGNTSDFIFNVQQIISYISQYMSLMPGDIISTGTPEGVGMGFDPPQYLKGGEVIALGIEGLGVAEQTVKAYSE